MGLEAASYVTQLVDTNPLIGDQFYTCAAHLRLIKSVLQNSFPLLSAAVTASDADLSAALGLAAGPGPVTMFESGTLALFVQATAPVGWTQSTTWNDAVLRVTSGVGGDSGGSWAISSVTVTDVGHVLTIAEMPSHAHNYTVSPNTNLGYPGGTVAAATVGSGTTGNTGSGTAHVHNITVNADGTWRPAYTNVIMCSKN